MLLSGIIRSPLGRLATIFRGRSFYYVSFLLLSIFIVIPYVTANWNPYDVIGVRKDASLDQIKKAYREMARKLHPDKSNLNEDEAGRRFIELNKAFSILKDPERRSRFDQHGDIEENRHARGSYNHQNFNNHKVKDYYHKNGFRTFTFFSDGHLRKKSITAKQYYNEYIKESKKRPFFIFFYNDFCPSCSLIESTWTKITDELANYNIGSFTINVHHEPRLSQELGVSSIPYIACLIDGQVKPYHHSELSLGNVVKFTKNLLPMNLITTLRTESEQDKFVSLTPEQNRLSALIIHNENNIKLRYLLIAYELRQFYRFGHVPCKSSEYSLLASRYNLTIGLNSRDAHLLAFDEDIRKPVISYKLDNDNFDLEQVKKQLLSWPFLQLPKLFSQQRFDDLCFLSIPRKSETPTRRLCIILFTNDKPSSSKTRAKMIDFINMNNLLRDERVVFSYLDPAKQSDFIYSLLMETKQTYPFENNDPIDLALIAMERQPQNGRKVMYKWLSSRWDPSKPSEIDRAKLELYELIASYKNNLPILQYKMAIDYLIDEEGPSLVGRILHRFLDYVEYVFYYVTSGESFSAVFILILCALITSLFLYQHPTTNPDPSHNSFKQEEYYPIPKQNLNSGRERESNSSAESPETDNELKIRELKAETYNGMVRLLKPGYRSIILLCDADTQDKLLVQFRKAVWPYRRNKTLLFGYMSLDKNLEWYKTLLQDVLGVDDLNVNKRNCIGTVLSLNGFKQYFRVYHAKHKEANYSDDSDDGSFLGFNGGGQTVEDGTIRRSDIERNNSPRDTVYSVDNLLDRLPIWLDKMFDGLTKRYFVDSWPEDIK